MKSIRVSIALDKETLAIADELARISRSNRSQVIRQALVRERQREIDNTPPPRTAHTVCPLGTRRQ